MTTRHGLFFVLLLIAAVVSAQTPQASISGVVTDSQGAVIAGAQVVATSAATSVKFAARTNSSGFYSIPFLPIGDYTVIVEHSVSAAPYDRALRSARGRFSRWISNWSS